jgi:hypothetical protein
VEAAVTDNVVNSLTAIAPIAAGKLEALKQALAMVQHADPSPIQKVATVHFAQWVIFDDDKRLLFTVDFDGSWEAYLDDFIDNCPEGLDAVFGCCKGYPEGGATDRDAFKQYVRDHQVDATKMLSYSAYPRASVRQILSALIVKQELQKVLDDPHLAALRDSTLTGLLSDPQLAALSAALQR